MPEGSQTPTPPDGDSEATATPAVTSDEQPKTVEEVEAIWRNRVAGKDRAHNAEAQALRTQIETRDRELASLRQQKQPPQGEAQPNTDAETYRQRAQDLERELAEERRQRTLESRSTKYPDAAEVLDADLLAQMDEAKLAALDARLQRGDPVPADPIQSGGPVDPSSAPRRPAGSPTNTPPEERSVEDLKADLRRFEPEFLDRIGG